MNIDLLRELEGVVLDFYEKKKMMGVSFLTGVLGVLIDLKPAALLINDKLIYDCPYTPDNEWHNILFSRGELILSLIHI